MSESTTRPEATPQQRRWLRALAWTLGSFVGLIVLLLAVGAWYTTTADFQRRAGKEVVSVLEDATGGRVELKSLSFDLWHLAVEVDGLVIHGKEPAGEMPYLSAAKIFLRVQIHTFLSHTMGRGPKSHIGLRYLRVEEPRFHLMVDKDGNTNQPVPKKHAASTEPVQDTLLDLQAGQVELVNGLAVVNDKAVPVDVAAKDLNAEVHYVRATDRYGMTVDLADLRTRMGPQPEVQSKLHLTAQMGRDMASVDSLDYTTGKDTHLVAQAVVDHFAKPEWQVDAHGGVDLHQLDALVNMEGFDSGVAKLDVHGRNCVVAPVAPPRTHFWQRHRKPSSSDVKMLPPDPECKTGWLVAGTMNAEHVSYRIPDVRVRDTSVSAQLHITPAAMVFSSLKATLPDGGRVEGELKIEDWLRQQHAHLDVNVGGITLRTIMEFTAPEHYGDLGLDTTINGPVKVEWGGPVVNVADSVQVDANLTFKPTGKPARGHMSNVPVSGTVQGRYNGGNETVSIQSLNVQTPASSLHVNGVLGVDRGDPLTNLQADLQAHDLGEFDQLLQTLGLQQGDKKGAAAIPVALHGSMEFNGAARGALRNLDLKGHLHADNFALRVGSLEDIHIDSVIADAEYSPNAGVAIASSTIKRNTAVLNLVGTAAPHRLVSQRGAVSYAWDRDIVANMDVKLANAQMEDLLDIAGQHDKVPLTGVIDVNAHVAGTLDDFHGSGHIALVNGQAYGESFQLVDADLAMQGQEIDATHLRVRAHDMQVTGSGGYDLTSKHVKAQLSGNRLVLSKLDVVKKWNPDADATLTFDASADGTFEQPNLHANVRLDDISAEGKALGNLTATASSTGSNVSYQVQAALVGSQLAASGTTSLMGDCMTNAKLTLTKLDAANVLALFAPGSMKASSQVSAAITLSGPLRTPTKLVGEAEFPQFEVNLQGIGLKASGPIHASLRDGVATLDKLQIAGDGTNLQANGRAKLFGDADPNGGPISMHANGSANAALIQTFDPELIASGNLSFNVAAEGRLKKPGLTGDVTFQNVNLAMDGLPNGLSQMNGKMVFNEGRLDVSNLTATSGGGQIKLGGSILYQKGLFAEVTADASNVRVRYAGLSATANAQLRLQGGMNALLLGGNILITRFGVGQDVDFARFAGAGGVQLPPDPTSPLNKIRLNVQVTSSPQLDFQNSYAKLAGSVDLNLRGTAAVPSVLGRITITDGSATFAGTTYQLDRGNIYFSNPVRIDPTIDLDVSTRVENYDITIGIHGTTTNLVPTYRSSPPLTEPDIFNLLALGRTQEEAQLNAQQQTQAGTDPTTSALLGGALNATVSSRVGKLFGAGSVKIDPAFVGTLGNSSARITVEEPLSKQLTLTFATNVNQSAQQLIQVQYQINDALSLVATRDESGVFSIVYKIRKRYK